MKQATAGSGSAADPKYPDTAAANADLEARLTGGGQHGAGGGGSSMPNEAQKNYAENQRLQGSNKDGGQVAPESKPGAYNK